MDGNDFQAFVTSSSWNHSWGTHTVPTTAASAYFNFHQFFTFTHYCMHSTQQHHFKKTQTKTQTTLRSSTSKTGEGFLSLGIFLLSTLYLYGFSQRLSPQTPKLVSAGWKQLQPTQLECSRGCSAGALVVLADREVSIHVSCNKIFEGDKDYYRCSYITWAWLQTAPQLWSACNASLAGKQNSHGKHERPRGKASLLQLLCSHPFPINGTGASSGQETMKRALLSTSHPCLAKNHLGM